MIDVLKTNGRTVFHLHTGDFSYIISAETSGVYSLYFGNPVQAEDFLTYRPGGHHSSFDYDTYLERSEFNTYDSQSFAVPCLVLKRGKNRLLKTEYTGYELENGETDRLVLHLKNIAKDVSVDLIYGLGAEGIIERRVSVCSSEALSCEKISSGAFVLPQGQQSRIRYVHGKWAAEAQVDERNVTPGVFTIQSKRGIPGPHFNPSVALADPSADEDNGNVWYALLGYSGNWKIDVENTAFGNTRIVAGISDFDHIKNLNSGEEYVTPPLYLGFTSGGFGEMSRRLHRFINHEIAPARKFPPVLYNSWFATEFNVQVGEQMALADRAAEVGCELFVVDDGWFGERNSDKAGLGDWTVNRVKFPNGLNELIDHVHGLGMKFGIWVEPEAINPDSDLYRNHPDWIYRSDDQEPITLRNQYELDFSKPGVKEYLEEMLRSLLRDNRIDFLKWDMNRSLTDIDASDDREPCEIRERHVEVLYSLWSMIRREFPEVELETCSGGGGRMEAGILRYAHQFWPSDNTDPYDRLLIQNGCTQFYPAGMMCCWVCSGGSAPREAAGLKFRFHSAMCGALGLGADITKYTAEELEQCRKYVSEYKKIREIITGGSLYRIGMPGRDNVASVLYVSEDRDRAVLFSFLHSQCFGDPVGRVQLKGLIPYKKYRIVREDELNGEKKPVSETLTGNTLMNFGFAMNLHGDFDSEMTVFESTELK